MEPSVLKILKMNNDQYEQMVMVIWFKWCTNITDNSKTFQDKSTQKLMTCQPLFNWWQKELRKLEEIYIEHNSPYQNQLTRHQAKMLYIEATMLIFTRFSKPLLKKAYDSNSD
jgi:hypothetical protein